MNGLFTLPSYAGTFISPSTLRAISYCHSTPERSCRRRSYDLSVAVRRQSAHVAGDPATDQLPFDARAILRPIDCSQSQPVVGNSNIQARWPHINELWAGFLFFTNIDYILVVVPPWTIFLPLCSQYVIISLHSVVVRNVSSVVPRQGLCSPCVCS